MNEQGRAEPFWIMRDGSVVGISEAEALLVDFVRKCEQVLEGAVNELVNFYTRNGQPQLAVEPLENLIRSINNPERKAAAFLRMGALMERLKDFSAAASAYSQALALEPENPELWYWTHNNLGFCLNQLGRHAEAEHFCRSAIEKDPSRHNAHKNLGVALAGQGQYLEAAGTFIKATHLNPRDPRALQHLNQLVVDHPVVLQDDPAMAAEVEECRRIGHS